MNIDIFLLLLLSHFFADFPFQTKYIVNHRNGKNAGEKICYNGVHAVIHLIVSSILLLGSNILVYPFLLLLSLLHFCMDYFKSWLISKRHFIKYSVPVFLLDQSMHIVSILLIYIGIGARGGVPFISRWLSGLNSDNYAMAYSSRAILTAVLIVAGLWGVGTFINIVYKYLENKPYKMCINKGVSIRGNEGGEDKLSPDISYLVGILERMLIIFSIAIGLQEVVGFILATKSIARFKEFDDRNFVVYFITGSFMSFFAAIVIGVAIRRLCVFPLLLD